MSKKEIIQTFFNAYSAHKIDEMVGLCSDKAAYYYVPYGEQGKGLIASEAKGLWETFTAVMPDFQVDVLQIMETIDGKIVCETIQGGTLEKEVMGIKALGKKNWVPHIYVLSFDEDKISHIKCYWDNNMIYAQLGHTEYHN